MRDAVETTAAHYLADWGSGEWAHAFHRLIELGPTALPYLQARFEQSSDAALRAELVEIAYQQRTAEALPLLAKALKDPSARVWKTALDGLVSLASDEAVQLLEEALRLPLARSDAEEYRAWVQEALDQARQARSVAPPKVQ